MVNSHEAGLAVKSEVASVSLRSCAVVAPGEGEALQIVLEAAVSGWLTGTVEELAVARTLEELVKVLLRRVLNLGVMVLGAALQRRDMKWRDGRAHVPCPKCRSGMTKKKNRASIKRKTLLGEVSHERTLWKCPKCGHTLVPLDQELHVGVKANRHDRGFVSLLLHMVTALQFAKGCELFERSTGHAASTQLAQGLAEEVGGELFNQEMAEANAAWERQFKEPDLFLPGGEKLVGLPQPGTVYIMEDNSKVGIHEGPRGRGAPAGKPNSFFDRLGKHQKAKKVRKDKTGAGAWHDDDAFDDDKEKEEHEESRYRDVRALIIFGAADLIEGKGGRKYIEKKVIRAHIGTADEWKKLVHLALFQTGALWAQRVVTITDGGSGIWPLMNELLPRTEGRTVVQILDWCHAVGHLWKVGTAYKGNKTPAQRRAARQWLKPLLDELHEGHPSVVLQRLRKCPTGKAVASDFADTVRKCIKYFEDHSSRMHYGRFRAAGLLIGSGPIESVHAWVIQPRLRLPGMRWSVAGANRMLRLRCSWASGTWDTDITRALDALLKKPRKRKEDATV